MNYAPDSLLSWVVIGNVDGVRGALKAGANPNEKNEQGFAALHLAVIYRKTDLIPILIEHGADIELKNSADDDVLTMAARRDDTEILDIIDRAQKKRTALTNKMASELSEKIGGLLMSYSGPEPGQVRTAIVKLAKDDLKMTDYYVNRAKQDYRDVLWWAEIQEEEEKKKVSLSGMTVNERLSFLQLFPEFDAAIARKDRKGASAILQKCELSNLNIEKILDAEFKNT